MKRLAFLSLALLLLPSCESTDEPQRKPVHPHEDISGLPWDRPQGWEGNSGMGSMLPTSH